LIRSGLTHFRHKAVNNNIIPITLPGIKPFTSHPTNSPSAKKKSTIKIPGNIVKVKGKRL